MCPVLNIVNHPPALVLVSAVHKAQRVRAAKAVPVYGTILVQLGNKDVPQAPPPNPVVEPPPQAANSFLVVVAIDDLVRGLGKGDEGVKARVTGRAKEKLFPRPPCSPLGCIGVGAGTFWAFLGRSRAFLGRKWVESGIPEDGP